MTIDSSVVVCILQNEPEAAKFATLIEADSKRLMSAVSVLETGMVLEGRSGDAAGAALDLFLHRAGIQIVAFDDLQVVIARLAFRRFGKGRHPARLNFADCASYALAQWSGEPLLYKGDDFSLTDVGRVKGLI
jgi:ribonuclease VapC